MRISKNKLLATVLILTTVLAMFGVVSLNATNYINVNDYCWIEGVFHSDSYELYPYRQESIDIGFSKYGEMIGYNEATGIGLGLQYPGYHSAGDTYDQEEGTSVDPWANEEVDVDLWMNGWFIDIWYKKAPGVYREIWAMALFSDGALHGGAWQKMPEVAADSAARPLWQRYAPFANPDSDVYPSPKPPYGGRKTNGDCITYPITIVYNGPRKFIAVLQTRVKDGPTNLVDIFFTLIFNKANKNLIVLKDVKRLYDKGPMNIQFGNRGEWDLSPPAYVHFFTYEPVQSWDLDDPAANDDINPIDEGHEFFFEYMADDKNKHPKKWWDELPPSELPEYIEGENFVDRIESVEWFEGLYTCYGREWHTDKTIKEHSYAVAQVIDDDGEYVGAMGVWPHPEFWSVQNSYPDPYPPYDDIPLMLAPISRMLSWHTWLVTEDPGSIGDIDGKLPDRENVWIKLDDMESEPSIPFVIYEHDFMLEMGVLDIYRVVSAYVLTDYHDADDANAPDLNGDTFNTNVLDREIQYQLDEIFDPWDINDVMHKWTKRWVQFYEGDDEAWNFTLDPVREIEVGDEIPTLPVFPYEFMYTMTRPVWDQYCEFTERVLVDEVLIYPYGYERYDPIPCATTAHPPYYDLNPYNGTIVLWKYDSVKKKYVHWVIPIGSVVKVLWSSYHTKTVAEQWEGDCYTQIFPLHHDMDPFLKYYEPFGNGAEVFLVEEEPYRILYETPYYPGGPYYNWTNTATYPSGHGVLNVYNLTDIGVEIDVKYCYCPVLGLWSEEKFVSNGSDQSFDLQYAVYYLEKVWIHSEKAITDGDYVVVYDYDPDPPYNATDAYIYMQDAVCEGEWLLVTYNSSSVYHEDWFYATGAHEWDRNIFKLGGHRIPDVGTLHVYNTEVWEEILPEKYYGTYTAYGRVNASGIWWPDTTKYKTKPDGTSGPPVGVRCPVPDETYAHLPLYKVKTWIKYGTINATYQYEECEWIYITENKTRGNYIIQETSTCDQLVLDQAPLGGADELVGYGARIRYDGDGDLHLGGQILKIVYEVYSGRYEWFTVGKVAASIDSLGAGAVTAAFKNKGIEIGIGGLDIQDTTQGPRVPSLINEDMSPDSLQRYHLYNDWCYTRTGDGTDTSWPIASSNIITVGGSAVNKLALYSNDWTQAISGAAGVSGYYAVTCWDRDTYTGGGVDDRYGYALVSTFKDKNGTVMLVIRGWTGQDTYYACKWFDEYKYWLQHINPHVTDLILKIEYKDIDGNLRCPPIVTIVEKLGTISEKPQHDP